MTKFWVSIMYRGMKKPHREKAFATREAAREEIEFRKILDGENYSFRIPYVIEEEL